MSAAVVAKLTGQAFAVRGGASLPLALNAELLASDAVRTEANAKMELRFADGATLELGPSTRVEIQDFAFDPQGAAAPSMVINMLEGAVRSVSGKVVEQNPEAFKLTTPKGAVGIRGTTTLHVIYPDREVHIVENIDGNHTVIISTPDGRSITMTGSALGVTITSGDLSPLESHEVTPGQMQDLLKIWLDDNNAANVMQHFLTGELAAALDKLAGLSFSGLLDMDSLKNELLPLAISELEGIGKLEPPNLGDPLSSGGGGGAASPSLDGWHVGTPGDDFIAPGKGNDFIWTDTGKMTRCTAAMAA